MPTKSTYDPEILPNLLPAYYKYLFPFNPYCTWLRYGVAQKSYFSLREFSFTLKDDVYIRYQSFNDQKELETEICSICPYKIDVGAVFSHKPKMYKTIKANSFVAEEKELVFDIDMTDYDDVRNCCSGAQICKKCWPLMIIAIKILDKALRDDFGFDHLLWIYSGRRGVHCWVCDSTARKLTPNGRAAIAEYLSVVKGGENNLKKVVLQEPIHPFIERSVEIIEEYFEGYALVDQDILRSENINEIINLIPEKNRNDNLQKVLLSANNSISRWNILTKELERPGVHAGRVLKEIMLQYCYPRLDVNVSKGLNHLLKSPFSVHPKTGRVCIPIDPTDVENFDPFTVPTISQLIDEINTTSENEENLKIKDYKRTSLKEGVEIFENFLKKLKKTWEGAMIKESDLKMEL
ncbi:DNA primase small subunit [Octopus sinensis]|uniref:DNA primase n=1 Tax=Octopus sinensis TaxID=2607531 RepID=A0A6P7THG0_9MOLL|nr:DNA primase small subunit [Octopus sinensis]